VQLLTVVVAQNQEWSHLILAGWNQGAWPPPAGAEFARPKRFMLSTVACKSSTSALLARGSQGEGHTSVHENHSLYLGPGEQRAIALRQFDVLLESASESVTLTASLVQENAPERFWNPSECFTELYFKTRREPLTQATLKNLQRATALLPRPAGVAKDVQQTLIAFNARRDSFQPAGEYDFALRPKRVVSTGADAECDRSPTNAVVASDYLDETLSRRGSTGGDRESVGRDKRVNGPITGWRILLKRGTERFSRRFRPCKDRRAHSLCSGRAVCGA